MFASKKGSLFHCFPGKQRERILPPRAWWQYVFYLFPMNTKNQTFFLFYVQTDKRMIMYFLFVLPAKWQSTCFPCVFQENTDFTCFPTLFSQKTVTIPSSDTSCEEL